jgi:N-acetyl sugar amidotransferase
MDTTVPDIEFNESGVCNYCREYDEKAPSVLLPEGIRQEQLNAIAQRIKEAGKKGRHDCTIGLSGGVDSTYVAYVAVRKLGLRPLAVHMDNGWNSDISERNVRNTVERLGLDLYRYVVDWEEFRDIQLSFLRASVPNIEIPTDHALVTVLQRATAEKGLRYVITGGNVVTESILPSSYGYNSKDLRHIRAIHRKVSGKRLKTFPGTSLYGYFHYKYVKGVRFVRVLNYVPYVKSEAMRVIQDELGWEYYGAKHHESIFTRFFQGYILPQKFGIDKRRAHLSSLICSGQMTRQAALEEMETDPYPSEEQKKEDRAFVLGKFGITGEEFDRIMSASPRRHEEFPSNRWAFELKYVLDRFGLRITTE